MEIARNKYLQKIISYMWDGQVKVITGIRRAGKSYLLNIIFKNYLLSQGVNEDNIISIELDLARDIKYRDPIALAAAVRQRVENSTGQYYLFIDEIQMSDEVKNPYNPEGNKITFYDALNDLRNLNNIDIYVTGSNSKMLSSDILTEFRGRSDEIRVHPLSFSEYFSAVGGNPSEAFDEYAYFGGMPFVLLRQTEADKMQYLTNLFREVYIKDIVERKGVRREDILSQTLDLLSSSVGSLTNPNKIYNALQSSGYKDFSQNTIKEYIYYLEDSYLFSESKRYDVKGKTYFKYPYKFYAEDVGLRNARLGFRQVEMTHLMENIVYNELVLRGYMVDVGVVFSRAGEKDSLVTRTAREIDFVVNGNGKRYYIQSAYALETEQKHETEIKPFKLINDSFEKIIIRRDVGKRYYDDDGFLNINILDFLLDDSIL